MSNNKSIQLLRGSDTSIKASTDTLLPGQPLYNLTTREFYVGGGGNTTIKSLTGITANKTKNALTFSSAGSGAGSGTTFDGSTAKTISYNTIGAAAASDVQYAVKKDNYLVIYKNKNSQTNSDIVYTNYPAYTITFNKGSNGSCSTSTASTTLGYLTSMPSVTANSGYAFKGWYTSSSGGTQVTTSYKFTGNATVYAQYSTVTIYKATLNANGGSVSPTSVSANSGNYLAASSLPTPTYSGYTFDGWYTSATGGSRFTSRTLTSNITLYAQWHTASINAGDYDWFGPVTPSGGFVALRQPVDHWDSEDYYAFAPVLNDESDSPANYIAYGEWQAENEQLYFNPQDAFEGIDTWSGEIYIGVLSDQGIFIPANCVSSGCLPDTNYDLGSGNDHYTSGWAVLEFEHIPGVICPPDEDIVEIIGVAATTIVIDRNSTCAGPCGGDGGEMWHDIS